MRERTGRQRKGEAISRTRDVVPGPGVMDTEQEEGGLEELDIPGALRPEKREGVKAPGARKAGGEPAGPRRGG